MFRSLSLALALVVVSSVSTVHAGTSTDGPLAGRWTGIQTCKGVKDGVKTTIKFFPDLTISQDNADFFDLDVQSQNGVVYDGDLSGIDDSDNKLAVLLSDCVANPEGARKGELVNGTFKAKKNGKIQLKAVSVASFDDGEFYTCKWKYEQADTIPPDPAVPSCSPGNPT